MERRASLLLLIIVLGISLSFAACPADEADWEGPKPCIDLPELGIPFLFVIVLLSVAIVALATMLGNSLQNAEISAWAGVQLRELIVAVIIVVLVWGLTTGTGVAISAIFLSSGEENLADLGSNALDGILEYQILLYNKVADAYLTVGMLQGTSYYTVLAPAWWIYFATGSSPYLGMSVILGPLSVAANNLTMQILTIKAVQQFMTYISVVVPEFLLPIALAFRIFPFTKNVGNTLIALCLGALFVLPLSLMLVDEFFETASNPPSGSSAGFQHMADVKSTSFKSTEMAPATPLYDVGGLLLNLVCKNDIIRAFTELGELIWGLVYGIINMATCGYPPYAYVLCIIQKMIEFIIYKWPDIMFYAELAMSSLMLPVIAGDMLSDSTTDPSLMAIPNILLPAVAEATGFSIVAFIIIVFVTLGGVRSISVALGGDYVLYGMSRFV